MLLFKGRKEISQQANNWGLWDWIGRRLFGYCWHWTLIFPGEREGGGEAWGEVRHHCPILILWGNCASEKERVRKLLALEVVPLSASWFHINQCLPVKEQRSSRTLPPETQSGAIAYLHIIKPHGIPYWNIPSKTRNETSLYKCVHVCVCV